LVVRPLLGSGQDDPPSDVWLDKPKQRTPKVDVLGAENVRAIGVGDDDADQFGVGIVNGVEHC